jgi:hypothetical protein
MRARAVDEVPRETRGGAGRNVRQYREISDVRSASRIRETLYAASGAHTVGTLRGRAPRLILRLPDSMQRSMGSISAAGSTRGNRRGIVGSGK